jgi:hypothetical protein
LEAPPETVAVTFQVHPFIVFHARVLLQKQGLKGVEGYQEEE